MGKQSIFESDDKDERELEAFGGMRGHQGDWRIAFVLIGVRNERGVIDELS